MGFRDLPTQQLGEMIPEIGEMVDAAERGDCPFCRKPVLVTDFRDSLSHREYEISGLCQSCQDEFFGVDE